MNIFSQVPPLLTAFVLASSLALAARPGRAQALAVGDVIINEYASDNDVNGNDFVELLVTGEGADLRGLRLSDNELQVDGTLNNNEAVFVFGADAYLANVPRGTLVTVWMLAAGVTVDTVSDPVGGDWRMVLAPGTGISSGVDGLGGSFNAGLSTGGEALYLYLPGPDGTSAGADNVYLDFVSFEADGGAPPAGMPDLNLSSIADNAYYTGNTATGNDDAAAWVRYDNFGAPSTTPGDPNPGQDLSGLRTPPTGDTAPAVTGVQPANAAVDVALGANVVLTFSEPVSVSGDWFALACTVSGVRTPSSASVTVSGNVYTLDPASDFANGETCTLTVVAALVSDQDSNDPPDTLAADFVASFTTVPPVTDVCAATDTPIGQVQGTGVTTPISGTVTTVQGVVVGDYEGPTPTLRGFYLQDVGDANPDTSDALFVFNASNNSVALGQVVQVTGTATEFQGQTQLGSATIVGCGATGTITPADIILPLPAPVGGVDYLERFEGMLVRLPQTLYVTEHFQLGRFGQVTMSSSARLYQPTHLVAPGGPGSQRDLLQQANSLNRILFDDALQNQNADPIVFGRNGQPLSASNTLRGGDTATGTIGVLTFTWGGNASSPNAFRVRPINALDGVVNFAAQNPRTTAPESVGGTLQVGTLNLLNYFNTFGAVCTFGVGGGPADCRGAENQVEFDRQTAKTVAAIVALDADVLGVVEVENDGYGPDSAIQDLVNRLNAATAPGTYAFLDVDTRTGQVNALGVDAIKVGILYKPALVEPIGATATLRTGIFGQVALANGTTQQRNRPPLAQTFREIATGESFTFVVNHFKSKGSGCEDQVAPYGPDPDTGDGQGNCALTRTAAANELAAWLATNPTGVNEPDILIVGDLNSYRREAPITALLGQGYVDLVDALIGQNAYSFAFDGQWGYLDYALASTSLQAQVTGVTEWHINADEPGVLDYNTNFKSVGQQVSLYAPDQYRVSDHDPVLVGVRLTPAAPFLELALAAPDGQQGQPLTVSLAYTTSTATTLTVTASVPAGATFLSASAPGTLTGDTVTWALGAVPAGSGSLAFTVTPQQPGPLTFSGRVSAPGAEGVTQTTVVIMDRTAPVTTATIQGPTSQCGPATNYQSATMTLTANEPVQAIRVRINGGSEQDYSGPLAITTPGFNQVTFFAVDLSGNREAAQTLVVPVSAFIYDNGRVIDAFNRRDGRLGPGWTGPEGLGGYTIRNNEVLALGSGPIFRTGTFGANQETFLTLTGVDPAGEYQTLILKARTTNWRQGVIVVGYAATEGAVVIDTFQPGNLGPLNGWHRLALAAATFANGDVLGARAFADGSVTVYKNCVPLASAATQPVNGNFFVNRGGRIGIWYDNVSAAKFDNFGGGSFMP
jgi:hypothetical protein